MQVILQEDVSSLGNAGEVVNVKPGYARNFLLPEKKAVLADEANLSALEHHRRVASARQAKLRAEAVAKAGVLSGAQLTIEAEVGEEGKLFGSVTASDIVAKLKEQGHIIEKTQVQLKEHIKQVGTYTVDIKIYSDIVSPVTVNVVERAKK